MQLNRRDISTLIRLLGVLQTNLESAIESELVPGTKEPMLEDAAIIQSVKIDRRDWWLAEDLVSKLDKIRRQLTKDQRAKTRRNTGLFNSKKKA